MEDCTVWICDDEPQQAGFLQRLTADWAKRRAFKLHITQFHSAEELLFAYDADKRVDILLLDIELPGISGMELARRVRQSDRQLQIVFVSGYSDYLADGYEVEALHYLLKPVSAQKLDAVLDRALERLDARGRSLLVESDEGLCRLPLSEISRSFFADSSIHTILFCSLLLRLLSFDFSLCILLAQAGQYFDIPEPGTYSTPHTVQFFGGNAVHRFVGVICNSPTKPMNL